MVGMLVEHRQRQSQEELSAGDTSCDNDFVFRKAAGGWVSPERLSRVLNDLIEQAGVPRITPNGLRRTAGALADSGRDVMSMHLDGVLAP